MSLETKIGGIKLKNPLIAASGTFGFGEEYEPYMDVSSLGAVCSKGLTLNPKAGNSGVRIYETSGGLMNSIGLQNPGVAHFIEYEYEYMKSLGTKIIVNLGGNSIEEYVRGAEMLENAGCEIIELNISCPNVKEGGMAFGIKSSDAEKVVSEVRKVFTGHLMVKLSPNCEDITDMALTCESAGADSLSLINTFSALAVDIAAKKAVFDNITAGYSGPAVKPIALRMVYQVSKAVKCPVIGIGGIMSAKDALEFIMAGASAVQIGTANFTDPAISENILAELENYVKKEKLKSLDGIKGII